ncbi:MAG: TonB-dependent receptor [Gammaproteobacteria bacterium]|nr:TonB-dependent receptor [Gammaproteobacteria bacterium]MYD02175.1 TonB-dependent receptor [Gammaproteobacteria bacterium]MYI24360.1 TonB-dependent receptor [Gammaproteobacteria bacterium]
MLFLLSKHSRKAVRLVEVLLTFGLTALALQTASAQEEETADTALEEIVVTGTHIEGADVGGLLPVTVMDFEDIRATGAEIGDELLRAIPQFGSIGMTHVRGGITGVNAARGDVASFNLRSLGEGNTLVLINGRRMVLHPITQTSTAFGVPVASPNANTLPIAGLNRVEVLRDGASSLYGADAVAGVVNYVLDDTFDGAEVSIRYGAENGTGRDDLSVNGAIGFELGGGDTHLLLSGSYMTSTGVMASEKSYSVTQDNRSRAPEEFRSDVSLDGRSSLEPHSLVSFTGLGSFHVRPANMVRDNGGMLGVADCGGRGLAGADLVYNDGVQDLCLDSSSQDRALRPNRNEVKSLTPDVDRINLYARLSHDLDNGWELYGEGGYYQSEVNRVWEQAAILSNGRFFVPAHYYWNPFGPVTFADGRPNPNRLPGLDTSIVPAEGLGFRLTGHRPVDLGPRRVEVESSSHRMLAGLQGNLGDWDIDTAVWHSEARVDDTASNRISTPLFQAQMMLDTPAAYNIFTGVNPNDTTSTIDSTPNPQSSIDPFLVSASRDVTTTLTAVDFRASRPDLFSLTAGEVGIAVGAEFRQEDLDEDNSSIFDGSMPYIDPLNPSLGPGDVTNLSSLEGSSVRPDVAADRDVSSLYAELLIPLVANSSGVPIVEAQVAVRYENFSDVGNITRPKIALSWHPSEWLRLRGSYSEGFRAPNLIQLNSPGTSITTSIQDFAEGILLGTGDLNRGPANGNYILETSGNAELRPEESEQTSIGIVLTPTDGLTVTLDWWEIESTGAVGVFTDENESRLDAVLRAEGSSNPSVFRDVPDADNPLGEILRVVRRYENLNTRKVNGYDVQVILGLESPVGAFDFRLNWAELKDFDQEAGGNAARLVEAGANPSVLGATVGSLIRREFFPERRATFSARWSSNNSLWEAGAFASYVSDVFEPSVTNANGDFMTVESMTVVNVHAARYDLLGAGSAIRLGITNVFDEDPPLASESFGFEGELHTNRAQYVYLSFSRRFQ